MIWKTEWKKLISIVGVFLLIFFLPVGWGRFDNAVFEALSLAKWYAREHVVLCLLPAFFIAGAIAVFISKASVMKYLGPTANKLVAYGVSSVSGSVLAVCSCTVLPLFAGIRRMGAGLGPAVTFLYAGPAINVLAIILTANVLGVKLGIARAIAAILFSIIIGFMMHIIYRKEEKVPVNDMAQPADDEFMPLWKTGIYFFTMVAVLVFSNWANPGDSSGVWALIYSNKWIVTIAFSIVFGIILIAWFAVAWWKVVVVGAAAILAGIVVPGKPVVVFSVAIIGLSALLSTGKGELAEWSEQSWGFAKQILPLLLFGVLAAGFLLGRPGHEGFIPSGWVSETVGGNSIMANLFASVVGAFMYFATLTEIPILQGLLGAGMGQGPALALLLAGPALSLPNMLVIRSVLGTRKTIVYVLLVIVMSTVSGVFFGAFFG